MLCVVDNLEQHAANKRIALKDDTSSVTYCELLRRIEHRREQWRQHLRNELARPLVMLFMDNTIDSVVNYLTCLRFRLPVLVINTKLQETAKKDFIQRFNPHLIVEENTVQASASQPLSLHPELALLMATSGSTGSGKCVALSYRNLHVNTESILTYLPIRSDDRTLATLPFSYSYGLSVLHSHLACGATIAMTTLTVMEREFWRLLQSLPVTSLSGVPHWYEMLIRLRFTRQELPSLRYFTQAGGRLDPDVSQQLADYAKTHNKQFFVMYGQTEATARIAFLDADKVRDKPTSVGQAIPGGELELRSLSGDRISTAYTEGELYYRGENTMLGYVETSRELAAFVPKEWLATGDLAEFDSEGDFYITGRTKRIAKLFGERVNLDELERQFAQVGLSVRCCGEENVIAAFCLATDKELVKKYFDQILTAPPKSRRLVTLEAWPLLANEKIDYGMLNVMLKQAL
ncbi:AMP-binding protein [Alteromonas pelagimontana]|nr:AMP-binding protein [Alteromonas pelagimontana]